MDVSQLQVIIGADVSQFQDAMNSVADMSTNAAAVMQTVSDKVASGGKVITDTGNYISDIMGALPAKYEVLVTEVTKLKTTYESVSSAISFFNSLLKADPVAIVSVAVTALIAVWVEFYNRSEKVRIVTAGLWAVLKDLGAFVGDVLVMDFKGLADEMIGFYHALTFQWGKAKDDFKNMWDDFKEGAVGAFNDVKNIGGDAMNAMNKQFQVDELTKEVNKWKDIVTSLEDAKKAMEKKGETDSTIYKQGKDNLEIAIKTLKNYEAQLKEITGMESEGIPPKLNTNNVTPAQPARKPLTDLAEMDTIPAKLDLATTATNQFTVANVNMANSVNSSAKAIEGQANAMKKQIDVTGMLTGVIDGIVDAVGKLAMGGKNPMEGIIKSVSNGMKAFGKQMIEIGIGKQLLVSLGSIAPPILIAGGVALELAASMAESALAGSAKMATGGIVSGSTFANIGEYAGASHNPEVVAPLDKLKNMMGNNGPGGHYSFEIQGDRMVAMLQRQADNTNFALGGLGQ